jgi:hypothetical protein
MEDQNLEQPKNKKIKFIIWFVILLFGVITIVNLSLFGWYKLTQYLNTKKVQQLAKELQKQQEEQYQKVISDTYGGKTPQETLKMYIDAVEKGDYELASKYFIEGKREKELKSFEGATPEFIKKYTSLLNEALNSNNGYFSPEQIPGAKEFYIDNPIYIRMVLYPNGIWKIIEI